MDKRELNHRIAGAVLTHPASLLPFAAGATGFIVSWVFGLGAMGYLISVILLMMSLGVVITNFTARLPAIAKSVMDRMRQEQQESRNEYLDDLSARLREDRDERTESLLSDLRNVMLSISQIGCDSLESGFALDIFDSIQKLFDGCVASLEKSLELCLAAKRIRSRDAKQSILDSREKIIEEVGLSVKQLSGLYGRLQSIHQSNTDDAEELHQLREELDRNLEIADRVQQRMRGLGNSLNVKE